jgi:hypothetical protein
VKIHAFGPRGLIPQNNQNHRGKYTPSGGTPIPQNNQNHPAIMQGKINYIFFAKVSKDI